MWLGEVLGGPDDYTRRRGGYPQTLAHHVGKAITEQQRRRWVNLLLDAADEAGLRATRSSGRRSSATSSGAPAWRSTTHSPVR
jgi:truncated hemoglobin YjbI